MGNKTSRHPPPSRDDSSSPVISSSNDETFKKMDVGDGDSSDHDVNDDDDDDDEVGDSSDADDDDEAEVVLTKLDDDGAAELIAAASEGRRHLTLQILKACPDLIQIRDPIGDTVFHVAARSGHVDTLKKILRFVSRRNHELIDSMLISGNGHGDTALHLAIKNGHEEAAQILSSENSEALYIENDDGVTPDDLAKDAGYYLPVRAYIQGVDIEQELVQRDLYGEDDTSTEFFELLYATEKGQKNKVREILGANSVLLRRQLGGTKGTALHMAARHGHAGILKDMIGFIETSASGEGLTMRSLLLDRDKYGNTPLHLAVKGGYEKAALELIKAGPKAAYVVDDDGLCPLYLAVKAGYVEIVRCVFQLEPLASLSRSSRQAVLGNKEKSLAHAAIDSTHSGMLRVILEHLPSLIDSIDEKGWKPISYAAYKGHLNGVSYLLENFSESVKKSDKDGSFPIHKAVGGGHVKVVKEFISRYPQTIFDTDKKQRSILHIAVCSARADVLSYLTKETEAKQLFNLKDVDGKTFKDLANELKI